MRYVVAYDVSDDRRRGKVARALEAHGNRVQYSVFEIDCEPRYLAEVVDSVSTHVYPPADSLRVYRLCAANQVASHLVGGPALSVRDVALIL